MTPAASGEEKTQENTFLHDCWTLYFHDPDNNEWNDKSYQILHTVSTVQDWVAVDKSFQKMWQDGMFFLMREHILPMWEDPHNASGGCFSFKVNKPEAGEYWFQLGAKALGEVLAKRNDMMDSICGVSISPKRHFCILRVWISNDKHQSPNDFHLETPHYSQVLFKPHMEQKNYHEETNVAPSDRRPKAP